MGINEWNRFGALLRSYSVDPVTAKGGQTALADMDKEEDDIKLTKQKAEEAKRGVFQKLLEKGIDNGADEVTLNKLAGAAGIDVTGMGLSGLGKPKMTPEEKRYEAAQKFGDKYEPASVDEWAKTGQWSTLKPIQKQERPTVLNPQAMMVDASGNVLAENKNVRPSRSSGPLKPKPANYVDSTGKTVLIDESNPEQVRQAIEGGWTKTSSDAGGFKNKVRADVFAKGEALRAKIDKSNRLSDKYQLAIQAIDEGVASGTTGLPFGDKIKQDLSNRKDSLIKYDNAADRVISILEKNGTAATGAADVAKGVISMWANASGLVNLIPDVEVGLDLGESQWSEKLNSIAGDNAELRTTMFNLGMQLAVADGLSGQKLTNQMIDQALSNIGANGRSPAAIKRKVAEVRQRMSESLGTALDGALGDYSDLDRPDPTAAAKPTKEEAAAELARRRQGR